MNMNEVLQALDSYYEDVSLTKTVPTGSYGLDLAIEGWSGLSVLTGDYSTYKTSLALTSASKVLQRYGRVMWVDCTGDFVLEYATYHNPKMRDVVVVRPRDLLQALETVASGTGVFDLAVVDGAHHLPVEASVGYYHRRLEGMKSKDTAVLFLAPVKQTLIHDLTVSYSRNHVGAVPAGKQTVDLTVFRGQTKPLDLPLKLKFNHNAVLDAAWELTKLGLYAKVLTKKGNWINYGEVSLGNGVAQAAAHLGKDGKLSEFVYRAVRRELL